MAVQPYPTSTHWGAYRVDVENDRVVGVHPDPRDPAPSPLMANTPDAQHHRTRVARPAVRRRWLENGPGPDARRGDPDDEYVEVEWSRVLDLLAGELDRVRTRHGNAAIFGGSYGWGSAGRIHHAQSQLHRFLNTIGGYTRSRTTYSHGAVEVLFPRIIGVPAANRLLHRAPSWERIREHTELLVSFGGLRVSNTWIASGGRAAQTAGPAMRAASDAGVEFVSVSPLRDDTSADLKCTWMSLEPGTDTAVLLALMHVLFDEGSADTAFLDRYTVGADRLRAYVMGERDEYGAPGGVERSPEWAQRVSGVPAEDVRALAHRMAQKRTLINVGWSVQRARYGEQPLWAGLALACCLGQVGLPGGGFASGYGSMGNYGGGATPVGLPRFPQGTNAVDSLIPVAKVSDMLLHPGEPYDYDGERKHFPDIRLVYWAGGNPFHHHQDLNRLTRAFGRPETVVVHETHWTATARHADIVIPATTVLERDDMAASQGDLALRAMPRVVSPHGRARDEYDTYTDLAERLGVREEFTEGRTSGEWMRLAYQRWRSMLARRDLEVPDFDGFWERGRIEIPGRVEDETLMGDFREDPEGRPLRTPSGRIELYSETIASFGYEDCPGHPVWLPGPAVTDTGEDGTGWPLVLVANQPRERFHSQQDMGRYSASQKVHGRAPLRMRPEDAEAAGVAEGDVVRVTGPSGSCLAGVVVDDAPRPGVVQLSTGVWYDPSGADVTCVHGNPNALARDEGTSSLGQGCTGQLIRVRVEPYEGDPPPVRVFQPPVGVTTPDRRSAGEEAVGAAGQHQTDQGR